jgi:hypothetical protein
MGLASQSHGIGGVDGPIGPSIEGATGRDYSLQFAFGEIGSRNTMGILSYGYPYYDKWRNGESRHPTFDLTLAYLTFHVHEPKQPQEKILAVFSTFLNIQ